ncbi:hypothetical protein [Campylobacter sp. 19-13652]|uniref:hypothetical protein n=1 Tax=Campylobacter sp. 19-13652 TaxID=2840180 RepID=UPI001C78EA38|nr:hypothetical protein [Campylobacter sp. 19-13652]BCX80267.1 hypothetical protein LBC_17290 [Campylobacter sp. 19-13652]
MVKERIEIISKRLEIIKVKFLAYCASAGWIWNYVAKEDDLKTFFGIINVALIFIFLVGICGSALKFLALDK